jgi:hypothetical protein
VWLIAWSALSPCYSQVQLPTVNLGLTNFEDGFAVPGWFLQEFPDYYYADKQNDSQGDTVPGFGHLSAFSTTTHIVYVSQRQFLGGWLAAEVLQPWVDLDVSAGGSSSKVHGLGDLTIGAGLQWAPKQVGPGVFVHRFILDVGVPTALPTPFRRTMADDNGDCASSLTHE